MPKSKTFVLSVGGSLIVTKEGIDVRFIKKLRVFLKKQVAKGHRFYLVAGGGATARTYIKAALAASPIKHYDRDLVGIRATRLNAELLRVCFGDLAHPEIITDPLTPIRSRRPVTIASGYQPGCSTDHVAVIIARHNKATTVINLSNIDYAYDRDPRKFPEAKRLTNVSWREFRKIVGNRWEPGLNVPFDPVASRQAEKQGIKVVIMNGQKLANVEACLDDRSFHGTVISS